MPELPEVETVVRQLQKVVVGKTIQRVSIKDSKVIDKSVLKGLPNRIVALQRRGKSIVFGLDDGTSLLAHLRMTGHFHYVSSDKRVRDTAHQQYLAGTFHLNDGSFFTFNEIRRFGGIRRLSSDELKSAFSRLGPEPLDASFTLASFDALLQRFPAAIIKTKLMDQDFIVGIGNIYAQEALYRAGIDPQRRIKEISGKKRERLYHALRELLQQAIELNGTTIQNYSHIDGKGGFQDFLQVYQQEKCPRGHPIQKMSQAGRGTYHCGRCQT